jgi:very-short-patch-repair endonuclease
MTSSKLEVEFEDMLKELDIEYERQFRISNKLFDFKIKDKNILIEIDGDFWHSNPEMWPNGPVYKVQIDNARRDIEKNQLAINENYQLIRFWECEVKYKKEDVKNKLRLLFSYI